MRVLLLSNNWEVARPVCNFLSKREEVVCSKEDINGKTIRADIVVSYCYRFILKPETLRRYQYRCVNLHNSYLPWGRGVEPLFFSVVNNEPCGVSIHWMDEGLDTGELIAQKHLNVPEEMTFRQMYNAQHKVLRDLFIKHWPYIRSRAGSYHTEKEFGKAKDILGPEGWDCVIADAKRRWRA